MSRQYRTEAAQRQDPITALAARHPAPLAATGRPQHPAPALVLTIRPGSGVIVQQVGLTEGQGRESARLAAALRDELDALARAAARLGRREA